MTQMMMKKRIPDIISDIKVPSCNEDIIDVSFSIFEILQGHLRRIQININSKVNQATIEEGNAKDIPMIMNIIL